MREYTNTEELYHHGILGMHWGIRRKLDDAKDSVSSSAKRYNSREQQRAAKRIQANKKYKHTKGMTVAQDVVKGGVRKVGINLGAMGIGAVSTALAYHGHMQASTALASIGTHACRAATIANTVKTGKDVVYDLMSK